MLTPQKIHSFDHTSHGHAPATSHHGVVTSIASADVTIAPYSVWMLGLFRFWYNHARPHQHLDGRTPAMAWARADTPRGRGRFFAAWDGWLAGYAFKT